MRLKLSINGRMLLYIIGTAILVYGSAFSYIAIQLRTNSYKNTVQIIDGETTEIRNNTQKIINKHFESSVLLSKIFSQYSQVPEEGRRDMFSSIMYSFIEKDTDCVSIWAECEPLSIDNFDSLYVNTIGSTVLGNFDYTYYRTDSSVVVNEDFKTSVSDVCSNKLYSYVKTSLKPEVVDPNLFSQADKINIVAPIISDNQFLGVVGVDIQIASFKRLFSELKIIDGAKYYLMANNGSFVSNTDSLNLSKSFSDFAPNINEVYGVSNLIKGGQGFDFVADDPITGEKTFFVFKPILMGSLDSSWSLLVSVPLSTIHHEANSSLVYTIISALVGFIILLLIIWGIAYSISNPIKETTIVLKKIAHGNIKNIKELKFLFNDEINDLAKSINKLISGINSSAQFAQQIGEGNLNADYKLLGDKDALGTSLIAMQKSLIVAKKAEDEKRIEDDKRNWVTHGLAKFGEVIRQQNDDMTKFTMNIAQNLVDYVGVTQVAVYINKQIENENADNDTYELKAAIAYGKAVMLNKEFKRGDELLGRAVDEDKTIYLKELPERYVSLSPGMKSDKRPNNLLIIPMHINNITMGALELLSYDSFQSHQIDFLERLGENIASVISSVKTNFSTSKLLEQSQHQADELAQHEEEMRQNLEEMQATQEEATKKQDELKIYIKSVKESVMVAELNFRGRILDISSSMSAVYGASTDNMRGNYFEGFVAQDNVSQTEFSEFWETMIETGSAKRKHIIKQRNGDLFLLESYTVIKKEGLQPKVLMLVVDKTKEKEVNELLKAELEAKE